MRVVGVEWDGFTVVGAMTSEQQRLFLRTSIPALQQRYVDQGLDISHQHTGDSWRIKVREYRLSDKAKVTYGPTLVYMESVRYHKDKVRLEFNPSVQTGASDEVLFYFLKHLYHRAISRADLAFDVYGDMSSFRLIQRGKTSTYYLGRDGKLETLYVGARGSDQQVRLYDKLRELSAHRSFHKLAELDEVPTAWWRLELQLRRDMSEDFVAIATDVLSDLYSVENIDATKVSGSDYVMLTALVERPELFGYLSEYSRKKYRNLLTDVKSTTSLSAELNSVLEREKTRLSDERSAMIARYEKA